MDLKLARRMSSMKASDIREILKVTQRPEVISFAGGLPAPELFPVEEILRVSRLVLETDGARALQYSTTEGFAPLREWIAQRMNKRLGTAFDADHVLITHGSQQALDLAGMVFLDEGDVIFCESPTYLAAINAFRAYGCTFVEVQTDEDGMRMDDLERCIQEHPQGKLIYIIPDFQNPTGRSWSLQRRKEVAQLAQRHNLAVIEDNPYSELRFEGDFLPSVKSFDKADKVMITGTFSKIFCPGYRIGWIAGDKELIRKFILVKQGVDLQCNTIAQMEIAKYLELYDIDEHIAKIRSTYKNRRDVALQSIEKYFPSSITFTRPQGGLFAWVTLPEHINARELLVKCLKKNVAFVPGGSFFPSGGHENTFRINFSCMPEEKIVEGMRRIGESLQEMMA